MITIITYSIITLFIILLLITLIGVFMLAYISDKGTDAPKYLSAQKLAKTLLRIACVVLILLLVLIFSSVILDLTNYKL